MLLRLVDNTPPVYSEKSRDFQLFLRTYDSAINSMINDAELIRYITDTNECKVELLNLLKTRIGYFPEKEYPSYLIRRILSGFSDIVRNKGSLKGVNQAVNLFLKSLDVKTDLIVYYISTGELNVNDHTVLIGIEKAISNIDILKDILRYVLPAGFGVSFFFYENLTRYEYLRDLHSAKLVFVGDGFTDSIRYCSYSDQKTYQEGDIVFYNYDCYRCLEESTGNTPSSESQYWEYDDDISRIVNQINTLGVFKSREEWESADEYDTDDIVKVNEIDEQYVSLEDDNIGNDPTSSEEWSELNLYQNATAEDNSSEQGFTPIQNDSFDHGEE